MNPIALPISWLYNFGWALLPRQGYDYLQQQVAQLEMASQQKQTEIDVLQSLLQEKEQAFTKQLVEAEEANNVLQADVALLQTEMVRLNAEIDSKQTELEHLRRRIEELETPKPVIALQKRSVREILNEIQKVASWGGQSEQADIEQLTQEIKRDYPDKLSEVRKAVSVGKSIKSGLDELYKLANEQGKNSNPAQARFQRFAKDFPYLRDNALKQLDKGDMARQRRKEEQRNKKTTTPVINVTPRQLPQQKVTAPEIKPTAQEIASSSPLSWLHPQDIRAQAPANQWFLVIDETGNVFSQETSLTEVLEKDLGRWVGLLVPEKAHGLKPLPDWHAVDQGKLSEIDRVVQCVLDANVGVLGLTLEQMPVTTGEQWAAGVLAMIDWVLRLVPLETDVKTKIQVQIENRGVFEKGMEWHAIANDAVRRLSLAYPDRAAQIELKINIIDKNGSPFNGYVDALAFTWGSPTSSSKNRLKDTQLLGTCFLQGNALQIMQAWEWLERGITIRPADWYLLLDQPDAKAAGSLTTTILERLGETCRSNVTLWRSFLDETRLHLDSKAIRLNALGKQIDWLEKYCPENEIMPSRLRLLWLTSKLAHANHLGEIERTWMSEMQTLGDQLIDEDAPLVCWADLHLAVNATNTYNFALASQCLARWEEMPCNVAGLRYAGQVQSSFGQHAAFTLQAEKAKQHFTNALQLFGKLSDAPQKQKEMTQTATYWAIVEIDHGDEQAARQALEIVLDSPIETAIELLAQSAAESEKYKHHLLLRWLVYRGSEAEQQLYLAQQERWQSSFGHPWALIQLYRACLLQKSDTAAAIELALDGYALTTEAQQGATVRLIGFCCRAVTLAWDEVWEDAQAELEQLGTQLPFAKTQLDTLREYLETPEKPLEMLKAVLPFNFH